MSRFLTVFFLAPVMLAACTSSFPTTEKALSRAEPQAPALDIQSWRTAGGAKVLFVETHALPMVDVRLVMDAGAARDQGQNGVAALTSALLGEGAQGLDVNQIAQGFENQGANFSTGSYRDMGVISLRTLSDPAYRKPVLDLFTTVIGEPTFPQTAVDRIRTQMMQGLRMEKQVPGPQVSKAFRGTVFADHPYGQPSNGSLDSLPALTREQLERFYQRYYAAGNTVIALVGDLQRSEAEALAEQLSDALPQGEAAPPLERAASATERKTRHIRFPSSQTHILLGNQSTWRGNPDHVPLYVGNQILGGGGFASILTDEVRQKRGYVYGVSSRFSPMAAGGPFKVQLQTANDNADQALGLTLELIQDFVDNGPTEEQLEQARMNILGSFALTTADNSDIIGQLGAIGFYDLPLDYLQQFNRQVREVTVEDIRAAFQRHLAPSSLAIVSIGPQAPQAGDAASERNADNEETGQDR